MATRSEVDRRKKELKAWVRQEYESRRRVDKTILPPVKALAAQHGISVNIAHQAVRQLVEEGVLHTVPGVGTFFGPPQVVTSEFFLFLRNGLQRGAEQGIQEGFEEQIALRGGACLAMTLPQAQALEEQGVLPKVVGIYGVPGNALDGWRWEGANGVPQVCFAGHELAETTDLVSYDDREGGRLATEHLIRAGHRRIALLGLHTPGTVSGPTRWSELREEGWRTALENAHLRSDGEAFYPERAVSDARRLFETVSCARESARLLAHREDITAVVAVNDNAALGLFAALKAANRPRETWPAVVGFDNQETPGGFWLTSLHLPADNLGRAAAEILWNRRYGLLMGSPVHHKTQMRLLPRLSSQSGWAAQLNNLVL